MTTFPPHLWTLLLAAAFAVALVAIVAATAKMVRADRSTLPPGSPRDWRDEALRWNRLPIV
ncbi:MAG: hypothetical protein WAN48_02050 [Actinomycetes bacterium]